MLLMWGDHLIQFYNDGFRPSLGADKHPLALGQRAVECWPEIWTIIGPQIEAVMKRGESTWHEDQLVPFYRNGVLEEIYWTYSYSPVRSADGAVLGMLVTCSETTGRVAAAQLLRTSEERLRLAQRAGQLATWDWDLETGEVAWGSGSAWVYGEAAELMTPIDRCANAVHPDDRESTMLALQDAIDTGAEYDNEFRVIWPDGSTHWLAGRGKAVYAPDGHPIRILGVNWDITARKEAELALVNERAHLIKLFQQAPAFVAVLRGPSHTFEMTNPLYQELIGNRDVIGKPVGEALPEASQQGYTAILDRVYQTGEPFVAHGSRISIARVLGQPMEERVLDFLYQPIRESNGAISGIIVLGVDVTERKRAEKALRQTEKLAAVGRLASSIAHEINNPLEAVTNLLYLGVSLTESPQAKFYLEMAQQELARVSNIATQTLRFHRQSSIARNTSLSDVVDTVLVLFKSKLANANVSVEKQYRTHTQIMAYEGDLRQVLANLLSNAVDASQGGGRIVVRVTDAVDWQTGERGVRVSISDNGHGMSDETRRHIFEPFFTTKGATGTGLGLWVSGEIIQNHKAKVRVRSSTSPTGHGSVFSLFFPKNQPQA